MSAKIRSNNALLIITTAEEYNRRKIVLTRGIKESLMSVRAIYLAVPDAQNQKRFEIYSVTESVYSPKDIEAYPRDPCVKNNVFTWSKDFSNSTAFADNDVPVDTVHGLLNVAYQQTLSGARGQAMGHVSQAQDLDFLVQVNTRKDPITRRVSSFSGKARHEAKPLTVSEKNTSLQMLDRVIDKLGPEAVLRYMVKGKHFTSKHTPIVYRALHEMDLLSSDELDSIRCALAVRTAIPLEEVNQELLDESFAADQCEALANRVALTLSLRNADNVWMNWPMSTAGLRILIVPRAKNCKYDEIILVVCPKEGEDFSWNIFARDNPKDLFSIKYAFPTPNTDDIHNCLRELITACK